MVSLLMLVMLAAIVVLLAANVAKGIEPRQWGTPSDWSNYNQEEFYKEVVREPLRTATQDELYEGGWIARDVAIDGVNCLEKQGEIIWCEK